MKKIIIFSIIFLSYFAIGYANWYWNHPVNYTVSPTAQSCESDNDDNWPWDPDFWHAAVASNNTTTTPRSLNSATWATGWNMRCLYWDDESPSTSISYVSNWQNSDVTVTSSRSDTGWSGIATNRIYRNGVVLSGTDRTSYEQSANHGQTYTFYSIATDDAGNSNTSLTGGTLRFDTVPPLSVSPIYTKSPSGGSYTPWSSWNNDSWSDENIIVRITCDDDGDSGCRMQNNNGFTYSWLVYSRTFSSNTSWTSWLMTLRDNAGSWNTRNINYWAIRIDKTTPSAPSISANDRSNDQWSNDTTTTITTTANTSWEISERTNRFCMDSTNSCTPSSLTAPSTSSLADGIYYYRARTCTQAGNCGAISTFIIKIDTTRPTTSDIWNLTSSHLLASTSYPVSVLISNNGWSPIAEIRWVFENWDSENDINLSYDSDSDGTITPNTSESIWTTTQNICNVDNDSSNMNAIGCNVTNGGASTNINGTREYTFRITYVEDDAWNVLLWWPIDIDYNVYSNTTSVNDTISTTSLTDLWVYADTASKDIVVSLRDAYGNAIQDAPGISRNVWINMEIENYTRLDQHSNAWGDTAVFIWSNAIPTWGSNYQSWTVPWVVESGAVYTLPFYVYAPTTIWNSQVPGNTTIQTLWYDISGTSILSWDTWSWAILSSPVNFRINPPYVTNYDLELDGTNTFREWVEQSSTLRIENTGSNIGSSKRLYLEFGGTNTANLSLTWNILSPSSKIIFETGDSLTSVFKTDSDFPGFGWNSSYFPLITRMNLDTPPAPDTSSAYLASIIQYNLGARTIRYPSDIINKSTYFDPATVWGTSQDSIRIIGATSSQNSEEVTLGQFSDDVRILWNIIKSRLRSQIEKKVYTVTRNINLSDSWLQTVNDVNGTVSNPNIWNNTDGLSIADDKILLFKYQNQNHVPWDNQRVQINLSASNLVTGQKTIIVENGDVYIRSNIINDSSSDILWIIALNGDILIDTSVTDIHAILYTNRSVMSTTNGINRLDGSTSLATLANQLYIRWTVFSENTLWWSRSATPECPYYVADSDCNSSWVAQKYDLNYLRRYFTYDSWSWYDVDTDGLTDGFGNPYDKNKSWEISQAGLNNHRLSEFPVIIEYNPNVQQNPPPFFD